MIPTQQIFKWHFNTERHWTVSDHNIIKNWVQKFRTTASATNRKPLHNNNNNKCTSVTIYRLNDCAMLHKTFNVTFPCSPLHRLASLYYCVSLYPSSSQNLQLVKYHEIAVTSLAPRPGYEVVTSEHRQRGAWTSEGPADPLTYLHIALRIRTMIATNCERRR
jgi:hypothetical protein